MEGISMRVIYIVSFILIMCQWKPSMLFKPNGKPRTYGIGYDEEGYKKTLYSIHLVIIIVVALLLKYT